MEALVEQRASPRVSVNIPVKLIYSIDKIFLAQITSLNENGFLCVMKKTLPLQSKVKIYILLPYTGGENKQSSILFGEGNIVREHSVNEENKHALAIKFTDLLSEDMNRLKIFIEKFYSNAG
jgi:hypothetical protein